MRDLRFPLLLLGFCSAMALSPLAVAGPPEKSEAEKAAKKAPEEKDRPAQPPKIQLAILLDTSNSMDGLINQARTQLWKIVNEFAVAKKDGLQPHLEVALFEYGKSSIDASAGHLREVTPLTDDLDKVSEELFALTTNGGNEYCGMVLQAALDRLKWNEGADDLKMIFVAGNEPFTQGKIDPFQMCQAAIERSITVSTIHCGPEQQGINTGWQKGALLADGSYLSIDQDKQVAVIAAPQDKKLAELSQQLNKTYVFYGDEAQRRARKNLQAAQDRAAAKAAPAAAASRAEFKAGGFYDNSRFDLVDALKREKVDLKKLQEQELPEELKDKSPEERQEYLAAKAKEREEIQKQIQELAEARKKHIAAERARQAETAESETLDTAIIKAVRAQAEKRQFEFGEQ